MKLPSTTFIFFPKTGRPYDGLTYSLTIPLPLPSALLIRVVLTNTDLSECFHGNKKKNNLLAP